MIDWGLREWIGLSLIILSASGVGALWVLAVQSMYPPSFTRTEKKKKLPVNWFRWPDSEA